MRPEPRIVEVSGQAYASSGLLVCRVTRRAVTAKTADFTVFVRNESAARAEIRVLIPQTQEHGYRTLVRTHVEAGSEFTTDFAIDTQRYSGVPRLHVEIAGDGARFMVPVPASVSNENGQAPLVTTLGTALDIAVLLAASSLAPKGAHQSNRSTRVGARDPAPVIAGEALAPTRRANTVPAPARQTFFAAFAAAMLAVVLCAATYALFRPQISFDDVPGAAQGGTRVDIPYRISGIGDARFRVMDPDGASVSDTSVSSGAGTAHFQVPASNTARVYLLGFNVTGVLGTAGTQSYLRVPPAPQHVKATVRVATLTPPSIRSLALERDGLTGGALLNVFYDVDAAGGSVKLVDTNAGLTYGSDPLQPSGRSSFHVPQVDSARTFAVIVTAKRGDVTVQSRIGVSVAPADPVGSAQTATSNDSAGAIAPAITVSAKTVQAGLPIRVGIERNVSGLIVTLADETGAERQRQTVQPNQRNVVFRAPVVKKRSQYLIEADYPSGGGTETIVQPIDILPQ